MNSDEKTTNVSRTEPSEDRQEDPDKWWVSEGSVAVGPYSAAYIAMMLSSRQITPATLVCRVGSAEWRPLNQCAPLAEAVKHQSPGMLPPPLPGLRMPSKQTSGLLRRFTNPLLPTFANGICMYCILIAPAFLGVFYLFLLATGTTSSAGLRAGSPLIGYAIVIDVVDLSANVAMACVLVWGGLLLKKLQRKGAVLVQLGLLMRLCIGVLSLLSGMVWEALITMAGEARPLPAEATTGEIVGLVLLVPLLLLALAMFVFEIVALIWLFNNNRRLPLEDSLLLPPPMTSPQSLA